jgi:VIT1/CCC1 family predicted Fe2+/Mn2+ transporter
MCAGLSAAGICLLVFASTFPLVIPSLFIGEVRPALRLSNAVAIIMMFLCGYVFPRCTGLRPWPTRLVMVAIGCAMVGVAIALGG